MRLLWDLNDFSASHLDTMNFDAIAFPRAALNEHPSLYSHAVDSSFELPGRGFTIDCIMEDSSMALSTTASSLYTLETHFSTDHPSTDVSLTVPMMGIILHAPILDHGSPLATPLDVNSKQVEGMNVHPAESQSSKDAFIEFREIATIDKLVPTDCAPAQGSHSSPRDPWTQPFVTGGCLAPDSEESCFLLQVAGNRHPSPGPFRDASEMDDMETLKPIIVQLYIHEDMGLKEMMRLLEHKFGLKATLKQYKTRLQRWDLRKNYKATDLEELARLIQECYDIGKEMPRLTLQSQTVTIRRLRRHLKDRKLLEKLCPCLLEIPSLCQQAKRRKTNLRTAITYDFERPYSTMQGRAELVVSQTKPCFEWCMLNHDSSVGSQKPIKVAILMYNNLVNGTAALRRLSYTPGKEKDVQYAKAFQAIDEACQMFSQVLDERFQGLLGLLYSAFEEKYWTLPEIEADTVKLLQMKNQVLRFFTKMSAGKLGCNHPLSILLFHLQEDTVFSTAVEPATRWMIDSLEHRHQRGLEMWQLKRNYLHLLELRSDHVAAELYARRCLSQSKEEFGPFDWQTREILFKLAYIHKRQERYEIAALELEDALLRAQTDLGSCYPDSLCIDVLEHLAWVYEKIGERDRSEESWRMALVAGLRLRGIEHICTADLVRSIGSSLSRQGLDAEAWLGGEFGINLKHYH